MSDIHEFIETTGEIGNKYLATGGPTSRVEERICQAGHHFGFATQVYATPTSMFVSVRHPERFVTSLEIIQENQTNFTDMMFYDNLLDKLGSGAITAKQAREAMKKFVSSRYPSSFVACCTFMAGFLASFPRYGSMRGAVGSGLITALVFILSRPLGRRLRFSGVFTDFIGCLIAFILSVVLGWTFSIAIPSLVIGSIILIVPGLTLTSAISELAEHNFVSGTVKMMKAVLILVAMGVAYLLVENSIRYLGYPMNILAQTEKPSALLEAVWFQMSCRILLVASFCIYFHIPLRALPGAIFCSLASVLVLDQFQDPQLFILGPFLASMTVGLVSLQLARLYNWPSQVFSTPGILSLVPGLLALSSFYSVSSSPGQGEIAYKVALTAGAITFGLFTARMPFRFYNSYKNINLPTE